MHRLIRERWKPFGAGMRTVLSLEGILGEMRQSQDLQMTSEKGKVMTWKVSRGSVGGSRDSGLAPEGVSRAPALAWGSFLLLCP